MSRYPNLCTNIHKCVVFYSLGYRHCKRIEAIPTSRVVMEELRVLFSQVGLAECFVSDNGTYFTSVQFNEFLKRQGVKHIVSAPYTPSTNWLAEREVKVVKRGLHNESTGSLHDRLANVLFAYRLTAQSTTGQALSELLLGRYPQSLLDLLKPNSAERVEQQQRKQIEQHNAHGRSFSFGDSVF